MATKTTRSKLIRARTKANQARKLLEAAAFSLNETAFPANLDLALDTAVDAALGALRCFESIVDHLLIQEA